MAQESAGPGERGLTLDFTSVTPDSGGVGVVAAGVARGLRDLGVRFTCVISSLDINGWTARMPEMSGVFRPVAVALAPTSRWQVALRRWVRRSRVMTRMVGAVRSVRSRSTRRALGEDIVWAPFHRSPIASDRTVVTVHDLRVFEAGLMSAVDQRIITQNVHRARAVVCSWPHPYRGVVERFPFAADKTFVIPLPVLNPGRPIRRSLPRAEPRRLLFPGYVTPHKNQELLVRAMVDLSDCIAVFTGAEDGGYGDSLRDLATHLGVSDRIEWHGFVSPEALESEYETAHLLVMPTRWEAASGPIYEAIARELPFVSSEIPPIRSQIDALGLHPHTFDPNDPVALVSGIRQTFSDYAEHVAEIRFVADAVRSRTWSQTAADYRRVFDWAAGVGPRPDDLKIGLN